MEAIEWTDENISSFPVRFTSSEGRNIIVLDLGTMAFSANLDSPIFSSRPIVLETSAPIFKLVINHLLISGFDFNNFESPDKISNRLFKVWLHYRETLNALLAKQVYMDSIKKGKIFTWRRFVPKFEVCLKFGLMLFVFLVFPSKAIACVVQDNQLDSKLRNREHLTKVILVGVGLALAATVSYALFYSPKSRLSARFLAASNLAGLSTTLTKKLEFLKVPDFLSLPVSSDIATELIKTLEFVKAAQFDRSLSEPLNWSDGEALLKLVYTRIDGLLNYQNSPDFNHASMRSIERALFIMCSKNKGFKSRCKRFEIDREIAKLVILLAKRTVE